MSAKPRHHLINVSQLINAIDLRAPDHHNRNLEGVRGLDLSVGGLTAAILGNEDLNAFLPHQLHLITADEGTPREDKPVLWQDRNVSRAINCTNKVGMLRRGRKRGELQPAVGQKNTARYITQRSNSGFGIIRVDPPIAVLRFPGGPGEGNKRNAGALASAGGIFRNPFGERMCGVDHRINMLREEKSAQSVGPTKTADAVRNGRPLRVFGTACERQYRGDVIALRQTPRQYARLSRTSEDKNAHPVAPRALRR